MQSTGRRPARVHTSAEVSTTELHIRIISARRAEREEVRDYEQVPQ
ncbi:MAG: hypothetical protein Q8O52_14185 [Sulfuritalea sp.]|nr:hypothetical protein [Sulfuritalea sp.]